MVYVHKMTASIVVLLCIYDNIIINMHIQAENANAAISPQ